ncbi:n19m, NADH-ubiquinone oxidoreductase 9.5 kDa subunit [Rhizina undulata]
MSTPRFWTAPIKYCRYAAHTSPAVFYSVLIGASAPLWLLAIPIRRRLGYEWDPIIPMTYPLPNRARVPVGSEFDDPE